MRIEITELEKEMLSAMGTDFNGFCLAHNIKENNIIVCPKCPVYDLCMSVDGKNVVSDWLVKTSKVIDKKEKTK